MAGGSRAWYLARPEAEHVDGHGRRGRVFIVRPDDRGDDLLRFDAGTGVQERLGRRRRSPGITLDDGKLWLSSLVSDDVADGGDPTSGLECLDLDGRGQFQIEWPGQIHALASRGRRN